MFSDLKPSAIAVAFFFAFVIPFGIFYIAPFAFFLVTGKTSGDVPAAVMLLWFLCSFLAPVLAGYLVAHLAKYQPLFHGLIVGFLGFVCTVWYLHSLQATVITLAVFVPGGILGALGCGNDGASMTRLRASVQTPRRRRYVERPALRVGGIRFGSGTERGGTG